VERHAVVVMRYPCGALEVYGDAACEAVELGGGECAALCVGPGPFYVCVGRARGRCLPARPADGEAVMAAAVSLLAVSSRGGARPAREAGPLEGVPARR
jgi:hypothetical protein